MDPKMPMQIIEILLT